MDRAVKKPQMMHALFRITKQTALWRHNGNEHVGPPPVLNEYTNEQIILLVNFINIKNHAVDIFIEGLFLQSDIRIGSHYLFGEILHRRPSPWYAINRHKPGDNRSGKTNQHDGRKKSIKA